MAGLYWMAVVLAFFLSAEDSLAALDQNWLTSITDGIKNEYALGDTFSLAVNVPQGQDPNNLQQVFQDDPADKVKQTVLEGQVYQGTRVVAAAQSGAVSRVLQNLQPLIKSSQGNVLIIYSEESPCGTTCTNEDGIEGKTNNVIKNWGGYAFVFSEVGDVPDADTSQLSESFKQLEISKLGLNNIFRCYKPGDDPFQCTSCSSGGDVAPSCVTNNVSPLFDEGTGTDEVVSTGIGEGISTGIGEGVSTGIGEGISTGISGRRRKCKGRGRRKGNCKPRGGHKHGKGGKVAKKCRRRGDCKRRGGSKHGKGGKVAKKCRRGGGCKRRKGGRMKKQGKQRKRGKGMKRGKSRRGRRRKCKTRKRGKGRRSSKRGGKRRRGSKQRRGSKHRKWGRR